MPGRRALLDERVDGKRRQVPLVEHHRVPQRDRPLVVPGVVEQVEQRPRARTDPDEAVEQRAARSKPAEEVVVIVIDANRWQVKSLP